MPKQFYILGLVLLLWYWPWQLFSGDLPADWLLSVVTMQLLFVISCNKLTGESWATAIIIIEALCMFFNILMTLIDAPIFVHHEDIMRTAFIIELLIISISLSGVAVGLSLPLASNTLRDLRRTALRRNHFVEGAQ